MRSPVLVGVLAGLAAGVGLVALAVAFLAASPRPAPGSPTVTAVAVASPRPAPTVPPGAPVVPAPTAPPTTEPASAAPPTGSSAPATPAVAGLDAPAPALELETLGGGRVSLAAIGRPVWVNFMNTSCPSCRDELPMMERFGAQVGDELEIVVVDVQEPDEVVERYMRELDVDLTVALDRDGSVMRRWGPVVLPVHYWVDAAGVVRGFAYGGYPPLLIEGVQSIVPGASLSP